MDSRLSWFFVPVKVHAIAEDEKTVGEIKQIPYVVIGEDKDGEKREIGMAELFKLDMKGHNSYLQYMETLTNEDGEFGDIISTLDSLSTARYFPEETIIVLNQIKINLILRNSGIGTVLMTNIINQCRNDNIKRIVLHAHPILSFREMNAKSDDEIELDKNRLITYYSKFGFTSINKAYVNYMELIL